MGTANKVPGVSGGAVAFVLGFYEEMIYTFQKINLKAFKLLFSGRFRSFLAYTNTSFLVLVMGGSLFSYFSMSILLDYLLLHYEMQVWSTFFGMIIGSVIYISKKFTDWNWNNRLLVLIGILIGAALSFLPPATENSNLWFVFACGIIGVSGMTLPGLSGSFILMLMGNYVLLLVDSVNVVFETIHSIILGDFEVLNLPYNRMYLKIAGTFFLGSVFGLIFTSHLLGYVLKRWNSIVTTLIIGFITGSLGMLWPWKNKLFFYDNGNLVLDQNNAPIVDTYQYYFPNLFTADTWFIISFIFVGIAIVLGIGYFERKRQNN